jgi:hypothetical protein
MRFRVTGLPTEHFAHLFDLTDDELATRGAVCCIAEARALGYPCRVSLTDSQEGDELVLVNYEHHAVAPPYRMRFAIYVRRVRRPTTPSTGCPSSCAGARSQRFVRCRRDAGSATNWPTGGNVSPASRSCSATGRAAYLHVHFAAAGCYAAWIRQTQDLFLFMRCAIPVRTSFVDPT